MTAKGLQRNSIRLRWYRCVNGYALSNQAYYRVQDMPYGGDEPPYINPVEEVGAEIEEYEVSIGEERIFSNLLEMPDTDDAILDFSKRWGQLGKRANSRKIFTHLRLQLQRIYERKHKLQLRELGNALEGQRLAGATIQFERRSKRGPVELYWYVETLYDFIWMEVVHDLGNITGSVMAQCACCNNWFVKRSIKGRRPVHCSPACKQQLYLFRKKQKCRD